MRLGILKFFRLVVIYFSSFTLQLGCASLPKASPPPKKVVKVATRAPVPQPTPIPKIVINYNENNYYCPRVSK
jgi:hypothetical protein